MSKTGIDHEALAQQFAQASAQQGEALRKAVQQATLKALQGRELTLKSIRDVLKAATQAASAGAARSSLPTADVEAMLTRAVEGMDAALVKAVEANRRALQQFVDQGVELRQTQLKKALADIEKMEDVLYSSVDKAIGDVAQALQAPWASALGGVKLKGSATGASATAALEQLASRARDTARQGRALAQRGVEAWMEHYTAIARGVLIGLSEGLDPAASEPAPAPAPTPAPAPAPAKKAAARARKA